jgi:hypothetical protein
MISDVPHMLAVKATFDGERIVLPDQVRGLPPGQVIVIFEEAVDGEDRTLWVRAQEAAFAKAWDDPEDEVYDRL